MKLVRTARRRAGLVLTTALLGAAMALPAQAGAGERPFAPLDRPGPRLTVDRASLAQSLACTGDLRSGKHRPVLFVSGTTATPRENYSWNYFKAFDAQRRAYCALTLPDNAMGDIQVSAEYVVHALRTMRQRAGGRVSIIGHSQGGMVPRWALRFWPDVRTAVDDYVAFAPTNHGSDVVTGMCAGGCAPALWQQAAGSHFIRALNSGTETFHGISYTVVYTRTDEFVQPNLDDTGTSSLRGGGGRVANVAIQDICPTDSNGHLGVGTFDPAAYALALDALDHLGPAKPARVNTEVCRQPFHPGVDPLLFPTDYLASAQVVMTELATQQTSPAEPPLKGYVFG